MELSQDRKPGSGRLAAVSSGDPEPPFEWETYSSLVSLIQGRVLCRARDSLSRARCSPKVSEGSPHGPRALVREKKYLPEGTRPTPLSAMTRFSMELSCPREPAFNLLVSNSHQPLFRLLPRGSSRSILLFSLDTHMPPGKIILSQACDPAEKGRASWKPRLPAASSSLSLRPAVISGIRLKGCPAALPNPQGGKNP